MKYPDDDDDDDHDGGDDDDDDGENAFGKLRYFLG